MNTQRNIYIINGPNLNRLGRRDRDLYGCRSFEEVLADLQNRFDGKVQICYSQHNGEGEVINALQQASDDALAAGVVINPGAFAHYSYAIADALADLRLAGLPAVEVHISNIAAREGFRQNMVTGAQCCGIISGLGTDGYGIAIDWILSNDER